MARMQGRRLKGNLSAKHPVEGGELPAPDTRHAGSEAAAKWRKQHQFQRDSVGRKRAYVTYLFILIGYAVLMIAFGVILSRRLHKSGDFFVAGREAILNHRAGHKPAKCQLLTASGEDESQHTLYLDRHTIDGCRFEDPLSRRLYCCAAQRKVAADSRSLNDGSLLRDDDPHFNRPIGIHLFRTPRVDGLDLNNGVAAHNIF